MALVALHWLHNHCNATSAFKGKIIFTMPFKAEFLSVAFISHTCRTWRPSSKLPLGNGRQPLPGEARDTCVHEGVIILVAGGSRVDCSL